MTQTKKRTTKKVTPKKAAVKKNVAKRTPTKKVSVAKRKKVLTIKAEASKVGRGIVLKPNNIVTDTSGKKIGSYSIK